MITSLFNNKRRIHIFIFNRSRHLNKFLLKNILNQGIAPRKNFLIFLNFLPGSYCKRDSIAI
jgi:hypothetical protein